MDAAQALSDQRYSWHHTQEECEAVIDSGYPYGFGINLTVFTGVAAEDAAQHAHENWLNSSGHFETMMRRNLLLYDRWQTEHPQSLRITEYGYGKVFQPHAEGPFLIPQNGKEFFNI